MSRRRRLTALALVVLLVAADAPAQNDVDFGDDASPWANDRQCDDPRFAGERVAMSASNEDQLHDATDCRLLYDDGAITLRAPVQADATIELGDDSSLWAHDGQCDDPRFSGVGTASRLFDENFYGDATDCGALAAQGLITLRREHQTPSTTLGESEETMAWLGPGDGKLDTGEFFDRYTVDGRAGERIIIDLRSSQFIPAVILTVQSGREYFEFREPRSIKVSKARTRKRSPSRLRLSPGNPTTLAMPRRPPWR